MKLRLEIQRRNSVLLSMPKIQNSQFYQETDTKSIKVCNITGKSNLPLYLKQIKKAFHATLYRISLKNDISQHTYLS